MSLASSSCLELRAPPRVVGGTPGASAPGQMGWLAGLDRLPPRVCGAKQKEWTCRPQGSVTPAQSPAEQLEEADCQALGPSPAHPPTNPAACTPESPTPGSSGQCAPLCPGVPPCPGVSPCPSVPPCVWVYLLSGCAPLCPPLCPGVSPVSRCFPVSGCAPLFGCSPLTQSLFASSAESAGPHPSHRPPEHIGPCAKLLAAGCSELGLDLASLVC